MFRSCIFLFSTCFKFCCSRLKLRLLEVDKGLLQDISTFCDHFLELYSSVIKQKPQIYTNFHNCFQA